jgi:hypothetical protein
MHAAKGRIRMTRETQPLFERPTCTVLELATIVGLSKNAAYAAIKRGDFASIRVEGRILVLTAPLRRTLGIDSRFEATSQLSPERQVESHSLQNDLHLARR